MPRNPAENTGTEPSSRPSSQREVPRRDKYLALAGPIIRSLGRSVAAILLARQVAPNAFGVFAILMAIEAAWIGLINARYCMPMITLAPGRSESRRVALERVALRWQTAWGVGTGLFWVMAALLVMVFSDVKTTSGLHGLGAVLLPFGLAIGATTIGQGGRAYWNGRFRSGRVFLADVLSVAPVLVLMAAAIRPLDLSAHAILWWGLAVGQTLGLLVLRTPRPSAEIDREIAIEARKDLAETGRPMLTGSLAYSAAGRCHPMIVAGVAGGAVAGLFGAAMTLAGPLRLVATSSISMVRPRLSRFRNQQLHRQAAVVLLLTLSAFALAGSVGVALAMLVGPTLIGGLLGERYLPSASLVPWAVAYAALAGATSTLAVVLQTYGQAGRATRLRMASAMLTRRPMRASEASPCPSM